MFEQEYSRANDRIHPRKELLQELEAKWAAEEAQQAQASVRAFPGWLKIATVAAGIVLCVGLGMGSMVLLSRGRGMENKTASAQAPMAAENAVITEEAAILLETDGVPESEADLAVDADMFMSMGASAMENRDAGAPASTSLLAPTAAATLPPPEGMHPAQSEAEVENAVHPTETAGSLAKNKTAQAAGTAYGPGRLILRDDLMMVYQPTAEQVHVVRYADKKLTNVFALNLREKGMEVRDIFWLGSEFLAVREQAGEVELMRFDVSDWNSPKHLMDLTQSGALLGAWTMGDRLYILSRYAAAGEEPLPWVNGTRLDFDRVLLDADRPCDTFTVLTVYEPELWDGFAAQIALLAPIQGAVDGGDGRLLLWTEGPETDLYVLSLGDHELALTAESQVTGTVLDAGARGEGFSLLLQDGEEISLAVLDAELAETARTAAQTGPVRWAEVYEDGAVLLTETDMHFLAQAGDLSLAVTGDAFCWLTPDRGLLLSADGHLQAVSLLGTGLEALGTAEIRESLGSLLDDPDRLAYDMGTGRLLIPAGQKVCQFILDAQGSLTAQGTPLAFYDHDETDQRELRCFLTDDRAIVFYKGGVALYSDRLARLSAVRY